MIIIGISGKKKSGKSTFATMLKFLISKEHVIQEIAFADALKQEVADALNVPRSIIDEKKDLFRSILQWWGTDWRRNNFGEDYWIEKLKMNINWNAEIIIIPDVRFENEFNWINSLGGYTIRMERISDCLCQDNHPSEQELTVAFFCRLINNSSLADLKDRAKEVLERINKNLPPKSRICLSLKDAKL